MPTYVTLVKWTEQGIKGIKDFPIRFEEAGKAMEAMGGKSARRRRAALP